MAVSNFPGYQNIVISKKILDLSVGQEVPTWRGALSAVAGVYLITDTHTDSVSPVSKSCTLSPPQTHSG
jgi:hypothetical protein